MQNPSRSSTIAASVPPSTFTSSLSKISSGTSVASRASVLPTHIPTNIPQAQTNTQDEIFGDAVDDDTKKQAVIRGLGIKKFIAITPEDENDKQMPPLSQLRGCFASSTQKCKSSESDDKQMPSPSQLRIPLSILQCKSSEEGDDEGMPPASQLCIPSSALKCKAYKEYVDDKMPPPSQSQISTLALAYRQLYEAEQGKVEPVPPPPSQPRVPSSILGCNAAAQEVVPNSEESIDEFEAMDIDRPEVDHVEDETRGHHSCSTQSTSIGVKIELKSIERPQKKAKTKMRLPSIAPDPVPESFNSISANSVSSVQKWTYSEQQN
ncbi:hypothetical protein JVU11DRAFT_7854 [Chiua virens]|nr:hypothetical protein JVU11DRAFT_7854 [Chiua virens]